MVGLGGTACCFTGDDAGFEARVCLVELAVLGLAVAATDFWVPAEDALFEATVGLLAVGDGLLAVGDGLLAVGDGLLGTLGRLPTNLAIGSRLSLLLMPVETPSADCSCFVSSVFLATAAAAGRAPLWVNMADGSRT